MIHHFVNEVCIRQITLAFTRQINRLQNYCPYEVLILIMYESRIVEWILVCFIFVFSEF